jgi:hypothetical protein
MIQETEPLLTASQVQKAKRKIKAKSIRLEMPERSFYMCLIGPNAQTSKARVTKLEVRYLFLTFMVFAKHANKLHSPRNFTSPDSFTS